MSSLEFINIEIAKAKSDYKKHINFGQINFAIAAEKRLKELKPLSKLKIKEFIEYIKEFEE